MPAGTSCSCSRLLVRVCFRLTAVLFRLILRLAFRLGGKAREKTTAPQRKRWARMGGKARAARHTPEELHAFAKNAGRRPWKLTPARERRILQLLESGWTHRREAEKFGISLRTVGRIVKRNSEKEPLKDSSAENGHSADTKA